MLSEFAVRLQQDWDSLSVAELARELGLTPEASGYCPALIHLHLRHVLPLRSAAAARYLKEHCGTNARCHTVCHDYPYEHDGDSKEWIESLPTPARYLVTLPQPRESTEQAQYYGLCSLHWLERIDRLSDEWQREVARIAAGQEPPYRLLLNDAERERLWDVDRQFSLRIAPQYHNVLHLADAVGRLQTRRTNTNGSTQGVILEWYETVVVRDERRLRYGNG
jgi:hypothetical protein